VSARRGGKPQQQLIGRVFGRLTVLAEAEKPRAAQHRAGLFWRCGCMCGEETVVYGCNLTGGGSTSCGCFRREKAATLAFRRRASGQTVPVHVVKPAVSIGTIPSRLAAQQELARPKGRAFFATA
jgi:hypothetical protein